MYKKGKKFCSTPVKSESNRTLSLSISDVKPSSSDSATHVNATRQRRKRPASAILDDKGNERKRKYQKYKKDVGNVRRRKKRIKRRRLIELETSDGEWEVHDINESHNNVTLPHEPRTEDEREQPRLFESPERVRDVGRNVEKDFVLSPPLVNRRAANVSLSEDEVADKENEVLSLDDDNVESDHISPIFVRSQRTKTYPSTRRKEWKDTKLTNESNIGDQLIDARLPTTTADLLWEKYIKDHLNELPEQFRSVNTEKNVSQDARNNEDRDTDSSDILTMFDKERRRFLRSKRLRRIKGSYSKKSGKLLVEDQEIISVSDNEVPPKSETRTRRRRKRRRIRGKEKSSYTLSDSDVAADIKNGNDKLMTFNEFNTRCRTKEKKDTGYLPRERSKVKIKKVEYLTLDVRKRSDGNFVISGKDQSSS